MTGLNARIARIWTKVGNDLLPFADAHSGELPYSRLFRLTLFQLSCGMSTVLLIGTLNRVMIVELGVSAGLVATMVALPLVFAPLRALKGFGAGLFAHASLTACMRAAPPDKTGLALGLWGAVQATCGGAAIALGGLMRDGVTFAAEGGLLGAGLEGPVTGYVSVYLLEIVLLFATIAAAGPLIARARSRAPTRIGLADPATV
jgi:hypothetical protein